MGSEAIAFPGLLLAVILPITSEVTAKELADRTSTSMENIESEVAEKTNGVEEAKYPGGGYRGFPRGGYGPGDGYRGFPGSGYGSYPSGGFGRYPSASGFGGNRCGGYGNRGGCYGGGYCPYRC